MNGPVDVALMIEKVVGLGAQYRGSVTANTKEAFDAIRWDDSRPKPLWRQMTDAWAAHIPPPEPELVTDRLTTLESRLTDLEKQRA